MAPSSRSKKSTARVVPDDLEAAVREAVRSTPGSTVAQLVKVLPASYRPFAKEVRAAAEGLAAAGKLHRYLKGRRPAFFPADPMEALDAAILPRLTGVALGKDELKALVEEAAPGHGAVLDAWMKQVLAQRRLFEHTPASKGSKKRYGVEPDLSKLLAPLRKALQKARADFQAKGIPKHRLAEFLLRELGIDSEVSNGSAAAGPNETNGGSRDTFLAALALLGAENPRQALLSVRELRSRLAFDKDRFDALALELMRDGAISLHHHDHPAALPEPERQQLVQDGRGTYYVGIAPRRGP